MSEIKLPMDLEQICAQTSACTLTYLLIFKISCTIKQKLRFWCKNKPEIYV